MKQSHSLRQKSYARRIGKSLSKTQKDYLNNLLPLHQIDLSNLPQKEIIFEIGFGMGEHLAHQIKLYPDKFFLGAEPYLNGVANLLKLTENHNNFALHTEDARDLLDNLPDNILSQVYILFPDPWPKRSSNKRRLINEELYNILSKKIKEQGKLNIVTDDLVYAVHIKNLFNSKDSFINLNEKEEDIFTPHKDYIKTKYHQKALDKKIYFFKYKRA